jgi:adenine/guanine/hypoxanthine permease
MKTGTRTEIIAGVTTFLAAMYIIIVNPAVLSAAGMPFSGVLTATIVVSALSSIAMGIYARNPIVLAPGMGINALFAYSVVNGMHVSWQTALGAVFWAGVVFLLLSIFNVRTLILKAIPKTLRLGIAGGIGLFISFIGFKNAGFIVSNPATLLSRAALDPVTITFVAGLAVTAFFVAKRVKGAMIAGIILTTLMAVPIGRLWGNAAPINFGTPTLVTYKGIFAAPDFSLLLKLDLGGSLTLALWPVIFTFLFTVMFDGISTFVGVAEAGNLKDADGEPRNIRQSLIVDSSSSILSGIFGTSSATSYIESAAGIEQGGRGGLTAVIAGLLFLPFMFFSPLLSIVPSIATAPVLVLVGVFMMKPVMHIAWEKYEDSIPAFIALILIPLTFSITQGIVWGFLSWTAIKIMFGRFSEITPALIVIDALAIFSFFV